MLSASMSIPWSSIALMRSGEITSDGGCTFSPISAFASGTWQCACTSTVRTRFPLTTTSRRRCGACAHAGFARPHPLNARPVSAPAPWQSISLRFAIICVPPKNRFRREELLDRHENRMPDLSLHVLRQVALAGSVLDQDHLADADHPALAVAGGYLHPGVEIDDVLPARRGVPVDVMLGLRLAKDNTRGRQALGKLAAPALLDPLHFDVAEMRLSARVGIQIMYAH